MNSEINFSVKGHKVKVINRWPRSTKLYIDGDFRDHDASFFSYGRNVYLSANLGEFGILEICPTKSMFDSGLDAYLTPANSSPKLKVHVFSTYKRLSLSERRNAQ